MPKHKLVACQDKAQEEFAASAFGVLFHHGLSRNHVGLDQAK